jgi:hypothetical protein
LFLLQGQSLLWSRTVEWGATGGWIEVIPHYPLLNQRGCEEKQIMKIKIKNRCACDTVNNFNLIITIYEIYVS